MIVAVSAHARMELDRLFDERTERVSERTADLVLDRIEKRALSLGTSPERGPRLLVAGYEELSFVVEWPYLIIYRASPPGAVVVTAPHGARDIESELSGLPPGT